MKQKYFELRNICVLCSTKNIYVSGPCYKVSQSDKESRVLR